VTVSDYLKSQKENVDKYLDEYLLNNNTAPGIIHDAIRYSVFSGGKRFRAALCIASFSAFSKEYDRIIPVAGGIELIHTYSLIHDDLPCMDDDDLRRGKPTLHKAFGEGIAVLAGDALNALAFDLIARFGDTRLIHILAKAIGTEGMIGGQVADIMSEGKKELTADDVEFIHTRKTAALIKASILMGATGAGADESETEKLGEFGGRIGLAFQIVDDILDIVSSDEILGKNVGSDQEQDKATYPKVYGLERSKIMANNLIKDAKGFIVDLDKDCSMLGNLADFVIERVN